MVALSLELGFKIPSEGKSTMKVLPPPEFYVELAGAHASAVSAKARADATEPTM
jgi:hypothetical protein